jgi:hypothetical protein
MDHDLLVQISTVRTEQTVPLHSTNQINRTASRYFSVLKIWTNSDLFQVSEKLQTSKKLQASSVLVQPSIQGCTSHVFNFTKVFVQAKSGPQFQIIFTLYNFSSQWTHSLLRNFFHIITSTSEKQYRYFSTSWKTYHYTRTSTSFVLTESHQDPTRHVRLQNSKKNFRYI